MEKGDTFPLGSLAWGLVDQSNTRCTTTLEGIVEVVDGEADVMDAGTSSGDELADGRVRMVGLEQLDERFASGEASDASTVRVIEIDFREAEEIAVEGENLVERAHGDSHVGDASCTARYVSHVSALVRRGAGAEY
jgi:hypothetical protein